MDSQNLIDSLNDLSIISLGPEHYQYCWELDQITLNGLWTKEQWSKELSEEKSLNIGLLNKKSLIAFASGSIVINELHIIAIAVHPNFRRLGLAKKLLSTLLDKAKSSGNVNATLEVSSTNQAAIALYASCGFKTEGSRRNYYKNDSHALIQWRRSNE